MTGRIPRYALDGVTDADVSVHPFVTGDGLGLNLTRFLDPIVGKDAHLEVSRGYASELRGMHRLLAGDPELLVTCL